MGLYIRGNRYYFKKMIGGKVYYKALKLKRGQERLLSARMNQVEEEILSEHFGFPYSSVKRINFIDYCKIYLEKKKHKKSWALDKQRIMIMAEFLGDPPLSRIGKSHIEKLEKYLFSKKISKTRKMRPSTVNRYFEILNNLFNMAVEDGYITENPVKHYQKFVEEGTRRALSLEELQEVLKSAFYIQENSRSFVQSIIFDLISFAINTGMRLSEILNLKKSYIQGDVIFYPLSETKYRRRTYSKNNKVKAVCINNKALDVIKNQKSGTEYVFPLRRRNPAVIRRSVTRIREITGIKDFSFHQLRHTTSTIVSSSVGIAVAKTILGHSDIKTTMRYTHPGIDEQRKGVAKMGEIYSKLLDEIDSKQKR